MADLDDHPIQYWSSWSSEDSFSILEVRAILDPFNSPSAVAKFLANLVAVSNTIFGSFLLFQSAQIRVSLGVFHLTIRYITTPLLDRLDTVASDPSASAA